MINELQSMRRCLELARKGAGSVSPNPMVGCVIVKEGKVIGEGFHERFGGAHAEVNAIRSASESVEGADVFVNLEPCSFFGKTPPCADLLIEKKVKRVHLCMLDPNPRVNGNGVRKLKEAGIEVDVGLLAEDSRDLNEAFIKHITTGLPFVTLKIAQSLDGKIALNNRKSKYITSGDSLKRVHSLRSEVDAVLVGAGTVSSDNPSLTVRLVEGRSPVRIVIDGNLNSPLESSMFHDHESEVILFHSVSSRGKAGRKMAALERQGVRLIRLRGNKTGKVPLKALLKAIGELGIASVMVEGGGDLFSSFIREKLADKIELFVAPVILGDGIGFSDGMSIRDLGKGIRLNRTQVTQLGVDQLITAYF